MDGGWDSRPEGSDSGQGFHANDRGAPGACLRGSEPEGFHERALSEEGMDDVELHALSLPVDDPDFTKPLFLTFP
jgi:hypothetical protein